MVAQTFAWWLAIEAIGFLVLPIVFVVFQRLPGRGYAFCKPVGLLLGGYLFWLALSLHLLPNRPGSIVWAVLPLAIVSALLLRLRWAELRRAAEERFWYIVAVEAIFFFALFAAAHLRSFVPQITGTEKPMDLMMINAASRSRYYTPSDPWLSGFGVSYYYFGYVIQAALAKVAAVPTATAFNLGLASTAGLAATAAFGLGYGIARLARRASFATGVAVGLVAIVFVAILGNLEGVLEFGAANGALTTSITNAVDIANLSSARDSTACLIPLPGHCLAYPNEQSSFWWWWRATRISPDASTITEFPFFSFLLGDLHPHVMAIPFVLSAFGLSLSFWASRRLLDFATWRAAPPLLLVSALLVGGLGFMNTWDLPTFGFLLAALAFARNLAVMRDLRLAVRASLGFLVPLFALAALLYTPFYVSFSSQASGLDAVTNGATRPMQSFLFWAPLVSVSLPLPLALLVRNGFRLRRYDVPLALGVPVVLLLLWAARVLAYGGSSLPDAISARGWNWGTFLFFAAGLGVCLLALRRVLEADDEGPDATPEDMALVPVLIAMSVGMLLLIGAELFYIHDVFNSRLNTVFKLGYQAWLLLAVSGAYSVWWLIARWRPPTGSRLDVVRGVWAATAFLIFVGAMLYPLGAVLSRTGGNPLLGSGRTLDGLVDYRDTAPSDVVAADWLRGHALQGETLVEAVGNDYSDTGRMSEWSGVPSVLGWSGHEVQWGRSSTMIGQRIADVNQLYTTDSLAEAMAILQKYDVTYVVVGKQERAKYPSAGLDKFQNGLVQVYQTGDTVIYRLPIEAPAASTSAGP